MRHISPMAAPTAITTKEGGGVSCYGRGRCCRNNPGWFGPGEIEKTAEYLGMAPEELFRKFLVVVTTQEGGAPVDCFAPVKVDAAGAPLVPTGARVPRVYDYMTGPCVFYQHERCAIHAARPVECRHYFCEQPDELNMSRAQLARLWRDAAEADAKR
jgi:Fe-S-cluster containining protein